MKHTDVAPKPDLFPGVEPLPSWPPPDPRSHAVEIPKRSILQKWLGIRPKPTHTLCGIALAGMKYTEHGKNAPADACKECYRRVYPWKWGPLR